MTRRNTAEHWFGRKPPSDAALAWGARGIIEGKGSKTIIHFPPSNQQWTDGTAAARKSLSSWVNRVGLKEVRRDGVLLYGDGHEVVTFMDGNREIQASRQGANGNVYVGAWEFAKPARKAAKNSRAVTKSDVERSFSELFPDTNPRFRGHNRQIAWDEYMDRLLEEEVITDDQKASWSNPFAARRKAAKSRGARKNEAPFQLPTTEYGGKIRKAIARSNSRLYSANAMFTRPRGNWSVTISIGVIDEHGHPESWREAGHGMTRDEAVDEALFALWQKIDR